MINGIDHIGVAVKSIDETARLWNKIPGLEVAHVESLPDRQVRVALISVGESKIELLESTDPGSTVAAFIERRGEGMHHLALGVSDIQTLLLILKEKNVPLVDQEARTGAGGTKTAFLHPKGTGILLELVER